MNDKKEIEAIHKQDLRTFLVNMKLITDFEEGKIKCAFCKAVIQENNFGAIFSENKKIQFSCSNLKCLSNLTK